MVRMSDLVRGTVVAPKPAAETDKDTAAKRPAAGAGVPPALPRTRLADLTPPPPAPPKQAEPARPAPETRARAEAPGESAEPLLGELQVCIARVREVARAGGQFPWGDLERLIVRAVGSLERAGDLFWAANNPAAPPGIDCLAFHQARVAVLAIRIGIDLGYERRRLIPLGIAGALIDVGLWQLPEGVLRRLDALSPEEQTQYHSHPRLGADLLRRFTPPHEGIVEAVLQHHEREQGQGFPQGLAAVAIHPDAKILGLVDTYGSATSCGGSTSPSRPRSSRRCSPRSRSFRRARSCASTRARWGASSP